ncbi:MAG: tRNA(adenine34) deaminase [Planctomycetota bacterium]|jgi:tRNA(adenine34) deaminase
MPEFDDDIQFPGIVDHDAFMRIALKEASYALEEGEVPVGAVIVKDGRIIGRGHNQRETLKDPTAHAEMIAITQAAAELENWRLTGATMYVTLEPCPMCSGALVNARIKRIVFGASDPRAGGCGSMVNLVQDERLNHQIELVHSVLTEECSGILQDFFRSRREK